MAPSPDLQQVFVTQVVANPPAQGVARLALHAAVGEADGEGHEGGQVVGAEL